MTTLGAVGTDLTATRLWQAYVDARNITPSEKIKIVETWYPLGCEQVFDRCVSLHQGHKSRVGTLMNKAVASIYADLFQPWLLKLETKVRVGNKRDIDVLLSLQKADLYVSVTTQPRERKDETWPNEYQLIDQHRRMQGANGRPFRFIGLFCVADRNMRLDTTISTRETKQSLMPQGITIVALQDRQHHARVLSEILGTMI